MKVRSTSLLEKEIQFMFLHILTLSLRRILYWNYIKKIANLVNLTNFKGSLLNNTNLRSTVVKKSSFLLIVKIVLSTLVTLRQNIKTRLFIMLLKIFSREFCANVQLSWG